MAIPKRTAQNFFENSNPNNIRLYNSVINPRPGPIHSHNKSDYNMEVNIKFDGDKP